MSCFFLDRRLFSCHKRSLSRSCMLSGIGVAVLEDLTKLPMMGFQQIEDAECFLVCGGRCGSGKFGGSKIVFFTGSDRIAPLLLLGGISRMSVGLR